MAVAEVDRLMSQAVSRRMEQSAPASVAHAFWAFRQRRVGLRYASGSMRPTNYIPASAFW